MKLTIDLVPGPTWMRSLRQQMRPSEWKKLRAAAMVRSGHCCAVCGAEGRLNCHEVWEYDDNKHVQRLKGFMGLCGMCHLVKHIGFADVLAGQGKLDYGAVIDHFMRINDCTRSTFSRHKQQAFIQWRQRSAHKWEVDLGLWKDKLR